MKFNNKDKFIFLIGILFVVSFIFIIIVKTFDNSYRDNDNIVVNTENNTEIKELLMKYNLYSDNNSMDTDFIQMDIYKSGKMTDYNKLQITLNNIDEDEFEEMSCTSLYGKNGLKGDGSSKSTGDCFPGTYVNTISYDTVNKTYNELFNKDVPKRGYGVRENNFNNFYYDYNDKFNLFVNTRTDYFAYIPFKGITINDMIDYYESGNKLIVKVKYATLDRVSNGYELGNTTIYNNDIDEVKEIAFSKYGNKIPTYKLTFEKVNNHYIYSDIDR